MIEEQPDKLKLSVHAEAPFTLRLHKFFFPGWQVYLDGQPVPTRATGTLGLVTADLPVGEYTILARFVETPLRRAADVCSVLALLVWIVGSAVSKRGRWMVLVTVLVVIVFVTLGGIRHHSNQFPRQPVAYDVNFQDEMHLLGYHIDQISHQPGDTLTLYLYWLAQETSPQDYKIFLHLVKPDDSGLVAQADSSPVMGYSPTTRWEPGEVIVDEHQMDLDNDIPPGSYLLLIGMYREDEMTNLSVVQAPQVLPGDRIVLAQIEVQ